MTRARVVLALCLAAALAAPAVAQEDGESYFNAGLMHLREGRIPLALEQFKKSVKADPKNPYAFKGLGIAYMKAGQYDDAVSALRKALELNPYYVDVRNDLGTALILSGKRAEGKNEFVTALNDVTNPSPEIAARNLGQAYYDEGNFNEAASWYLSAINRNKAYADAYLGLYDSLLGVGRLEDAVRYMEAGVREVPKHGCLNWGLGDAYQRAGRFTDARARLEEAARLDVAGTCGRKAVEQLQALPR